MAILRKKKSDRFTMIDNAALRDTRLSLKATGALVTLLSLPDGANVSADLLAKIHTDGRKAAQAALRELTEAGYYRVERRQGAGGRWATFATVTEQPFEFGDVTEGPLPTFGAPTFGDGPIRDKDLEQDLCKENHQTGSAAPTEWAEEVECGADAEDLICDEERGLLFERTGPDRGTVVGRCDLHWPAAQARRSA